MVFFALLRIILGYATQKSSLRMGWYDETMGECKGWCPLRLGENHRFELFIIDREKVL